MRKVIFGVVAALLLLVGEVGANDIAITGVGGRWRILSGEHSSVRMASERVNILIDRGGQYTTTAEFVFRNDGPATTVQMGFPESGAYKINAERYHTHSSFVSFATWVDGRKVVAQRRLSYAMEQHNSFEALWVKTVSFARGQMRRVQVRYVSKLVNYEDGLGALYDFTGGNWRGKVAQSVLTVQIDVPGTYVVSASAGDSKPAFKREGRRLIYTWRDWEAQDNFTFFFMTTSRGWLTMDGKIQSLHDELPVDIDIAGQPIIESIVDEVPNGVVRDGQTFVNLRAWLDRVGSQGPFKSSYDVSTREVVVRNGQKAVRFSRKAGDGSFEVKRRARKSLTFEPMKSFLFVPLKKLQALGAKFEVRPREHIIRFY